MLISMIVGVLRHFIESQLECHMRDNKTIILINYLIGKYFMRAFCASKRYEIVV